MLAVVYLAALIIATQVLAVKTGRAAWLPLLGLVGSGLAVAVGLSLPRRFFFPTPFRQPYSARFGGVLRVVFFTAVFKPGLAVMRVATGLLVDACTSGCSGSCLRH